MNLIYSFFITFIFSISVFGQDTSVDFDKIANKMVNYALEVMPGETVIITGTPAEMDLLGALSVAVSKAGGQPVIEVNIPQANKRALMETPIEYLKLTPTYPLIQMRAADCFIYTGSIQDPTLFADIPEERAAAARQSFSPLNTAFSRGKYRSVSLGQTGGIPTKKYAESMGANYADMLDMFWNSVNTDYNQMQKTGQSLMAKFKPNSLVKITNKAGTNLTCRIDDKPVLGNFGRCDEKPSSGPAQAWLPAGEVYACVNTLSSNGVMVIPSMKFRGNLVKNLRITFKDGKISDLKADENGDLLKKKLELSSGDKDVLSVIDIGINPNSRPLENSEYYSWEMAGMVSMVVGNNLWAGGNVDSDNTMIFHLANSTVSVGEIAIVNNGHLQ